MTIFRPLLPALCALLVLSSCGGGGSDAAPKPARRPVPVTVTEVTRQTLPLVLQAAGNVEPLATVVVQSQVGGQIVEQYIQDGQYVQAGDPLFQIDPRPFELSIRESQAKLDRDKALLVKATDDLRRYATLKQKDVVAQGQYDETYSHMKSLEGTIALNEAILERARLDLEYATLRAAISGRVGSVLLHKGNVVKANDDRKLCVINQIEPIYVSFSLPEKYLGEILATQQHGALPVTVQPSGDAAPTVTGELAAIDNTVDTTTGTVRLRALFGNGEQRLWPGQFVRVSLALRTLENAVVVPTPATLDGLNGPYVYVLQPDNTVAVRTFTPGALLEGVTEVQAGLEPGERVVLDGQVRLAPGVAVEVRDATGSGAGS